jgi:hypothetical protein
MIHDRIKETWPSKKESQCFERQEYPEKRLLVGSEHQKQDDTIKVKRIYSNLIG